jgi:hypothetical protein
MMSGGVTCPVNREKLVNCLDVIQAYAKWYQTIVLGCAFDRWLSLRTVDDFHAWLDESESTEIAQSVYLPGLVGQLGYRILERERPIC